MTVKTFFNLVISCFASVLAIAATQFFIDEPTSFVKGIGIYSAICIALAVVEFFIAGFSDYHERFIAVIILMIGSVINSIVASVMLVLYVTPLWLAIIGILIALVLTAFCTIVSYCLGGVYFIRRNEGKII